MKKAKAAAKVANEPTIAASVAQPLIPPISYADVLLVSIVTDPNQPRKFFDVSAQAELVESVTKHDVIQPVMVRPLADGGYMLVVGERRLRAKREVAALFPNRNTIPATIRELTNEEALELQIIENLQRKDVHPMEEAVTFLFMLEVQGLPVVEIAARVGKKDFFVKQRLKLNELAEGWQQLFFRGIINLNESLQIAQLPKDTQVAWFEEETARKDVDSPDFQIVINNYKLNNKRGSLSNASFPLEDPTLVTEMGACTKCPFNTAAALLFPEDEKDARCMNVDCFSVKTKTHFARAVEAAKEDPAMIFVTKSWNDPEDLKKEIGEPVLKNNQYDVVEAPEKPEFEAFREEWMEDNDGDVEKDEDVKRCEDEFDIAITDFERKTKEYQAAVANSEYKTAFVVDGGGKGKYITVALSDSAKKILKMAEVGNNGGEGAAELVAEIDRLENKEVRSKELDWEKVWLKINGLVPDAGEAYSSDGLTNIDLKAAVVAMIHQIGYSNKSKVLKVLGFENLPELAKEENLVSKEDFNMVCRHFIMDVLPIGYSSHINIHGYQQKSLYQVLQQYKSAEIGEIEAEQEKAKEKRINRVNERVTDLKAKLEGLTAK